MIKNALRKRWSIMVGNGYFPEELPPCFNSEDLIAIVKDQRFNIDRYSNSNDGGAPSSSKILPFSIPHIRGHRRMLGVPNPFHYTNLTFHLLQHEAELDEIIDLSPLSIFKKHTSKDTARYISKPNYKEFVEQRILKSTGFRYLLSVDITRFYPSIYTHSIAWAIHGKGVAKGNPKFELFGNLLDVLTSNCQDKQTMGIPIGPDSSRILSELIVSRVDERFAEQMTDFNGIRNVDDYLLFFKSREEAEKGRSILQQLLREYSLELNLSKERLVELPDIIETTWKQAIRSFRFRLEPEHEHTDLIAFFDLSFTLARAFSDDIVLTYAIAKLRGLNVARSNWKLLQSFLLNALVLESRVIVQVSYQLLINQKRTGFTLNKLQITSAYESFLIFHAQHDHHFEIVWALWFYLQTGFKLPGYVVNALNSSTNDFVILMLLKLEEEMQLEIELDRSIWETFLSDKALFSEHWLLAYEGVASGYFDGDYFRHSKYFKELNYDNVHFFKPDVDDDEEDIRLDAPKQSLAKELETSSNRRVSDIYDDDDDSEYDDEE